MLWINVNKFFVCQHNIIVCYVCLFVCLFNSLPTGLSPNDRQSHKIKTCTIDTNINTGHVFQYQLAEITFMATTDLLSQKRSICGNRVIRSFACLGSLLFTLGLCYPPFSNNRLHALRHHCGSRRDGWRTGCSEYLLSESIFLLDVWQDLAVSR